MADYEPISRRPIAAVFRRTAKAATRFCVRWGIHPDAISYLSILAALVAAFCFWQSHTAPWLLITAPMFCYLRLWFNMLDGMVALAAGKATARGEILNDLPDRISDIVIFVGVAHSDDDLHVDIDRDLRHHHAAGDGHCYCRIPTACRR